jgi:hypothetical protein
MRTILELKILKPLGVILGLIFIAMIVITPLSHANINFAFIEHFFDFHLDVDRIAEEAHEEAKKEAAYNELKEQYVIENQRREWNERYWSDRNDNDNGRDTPGGVDWDRSPSENDRDAR